MTNHPNRKRSKRTITLMRQRSTFANVPDNFAVLAPDFIVDELTCTVEKYYLPDSYEVAASRLGTDEIYNIKGKHVEIIQHYTGRPQLVDDGRNWPVLKRCLAD